MAGMLIGGELIEPATGAIDVLNPANRSVVDRVPDGTSADVDKAVGAAEAAFEGWSALTPARRGELIKRAAGLIKARESELARLLTSEQGKPLREAILEIRRFVHTIEYYAGLAKTIKGSYIPRIDEDKSGLTLKLPVGVVGAIVPWNFPLSLLGNKMGPALLAGNTMVIKPAETTPLTDLKVAGLFEEAGVPAGVLNVVTGYGESAGDAIVRHPKIRKIAFTGSTEVGRRVASLAAQTIKRVTLELGGSDPMIVCDDADLGAAAKAAAVGRFFNCGQACLAIKRLYLFESIADRFMEMLVARVQKLRVADGMAEGALIGPMHTDAGRTELEAQVGDALTRGATIVTGGGRPSGPQYDSGYFYKPALLAGVPEDSRMATEEVFGPALPIFRVRDMDEAIEKANDSIYGLGSSVWTRDMGLGMKAAERLLAGYTWINSVQTIYDELPFGGLKQSGIGKEHGQEVLDYYMETKSVVVGNPG